MIPQYAYITRLTQREQGPHVASGPLLDTPETFWQRIPESSRASMSKSSAGSDAVSLATSQRLEAAFLKDLKLKLERQLTLPVQVSILGYGSITVATLIDHLFSAQYIGGLVAVCAAEILGVPFDFHVLPVVNDHPQTGQAPSVTGGRGGLPSALQTAFGAVGLLTFAATIAGILILSESWKSQSETAQEMLGKQMGHIEKLYSELRALDGSHEATLLVAATMLTPTSPSIPFAAPDTAQRTARHEDANARLALIQEMLATTAHSNAARADVQAPPQLKP